MFCTNKKETLINHLIPMSAPAFRFSPYTSILYTWVPVHTSIFFTLLGPMPPFYSCFYSARKLTIGTKTNKKNCLLRRF